jgi:hypothetical protein
VCFASVKSKKKEEELFLFHLDSTNYKKMTDQSLMDKSLRSVFGELQMKIICIYTRRACASILCLTLF